MPNGGHGGDEIRAAVNAVGERFTLNHGIAGTRGQGGTGGTFPGGFLDVAINAPPGNHGSNGNAVLTFRQPQLYQGF